VGQPDLHVLFPQNPTEAAATAADPAGHHGTQGGLPIPNGERDERPRKFRIAASALGLVAMACVALLLFVIHNKNGSDNLKIETGNGTSPDSVHPPKADRMGKKLPEIKAAISNVFLAPYEGVISDTSRSTNYNYYRTRQAVFRTIPEWEADKNLLDMALKELADENFFLNNGYIEFPDDISRLLADADNVVAWRLKFLKNEVRPRLSSAGIEINVPVPREVLTVFDRKFENPPTESFSSLSKVQEELRLCESYLQARSVIR